MLNCPKCGFSNPETAKFCSNCGNPLEQVRSIEGERKFATILFADVARSTAIPGIDETRTDSCGDSERIAISCMRDTDRP